MTQDPRNWRIFPGYAPGDPIAEHSAAIDRGQPLEQDGVRRVIQLIRPEAQGRTQPIRMVREDKRNGWEELETFNPGQARWYALRLIEAAAIAEVLGDDSEFSAGALFDHKQLADWFMAHPELISEGSAADNAIRWLEQFLTLRGAYDRLEAASRERPGRKLRQWVHDHADFLGEHDDEPIADILIPMLDRYVEMSLTKAVESTLRTDEIDVGDIREWVAAIILAWKNGEPVNFHGARVPPWVYDLLDDAFGFGAASPSESAEMYGGMNAQAEPSVEEAPRPKRQWYGTLAVEGEWTVDGRRLEPAAIQIPTKLREGKSDPIPLMERGGMPVGTIERMWRDVEDWAIRASGRTELSPGVWAVGADLKLDEKTTTSIEPVQLIIQQCRLLGATVLPPGVKSAWPRAFIVVLDEEVSDG